MLPLSADPARDFPAFARRWLALLAQDRLDEACSLLDEPSQYGIVWTPETIRKVVVETFSPDTGFSRRHPDGPQFTDPDELDKPPIAELGEYTDGHGYCLDYSVPLNHEYSDLTAQFEFLRRPKGYAVILHDLHVM